MKKKDIIKEHYRAMQKKSREKILVKYGRDYYKNIVNRRWEAERAKKTGAKVEKIPMVAFVPEKPAEKGDNLKIVILGDDSEKTGN